MNVYEKGLRIKGKHFAVLILTTILTCAFVWVRLQIINISYDLNTLSSKEKGLREEVYNLTLRINESKSPRRLERLASSKFGMQPPRADQLISLSEK